MPKDLIPPSPDETKTATGTPVKTVPPPATKSGGVRQTRAASRHEAGTLSGKSREAKRTFRLDEQERRLTDEGPAIPAPSSPPAK